MPTLGNSRGETTGGQGDVKNVPLAPLSLFACPYLKHLDLMNNVAICKSNIIKIKAAPRTYPFEIPIADSVCSNLVCPTISYTAPSTQERISPTKEKTYST